MNHLYRQVWTPEKAQNALSKGQYIFVPTGTRRTLAGGPRTWSIPGGENIIYNTDFRIMGTPEDIRQALEAAGYDHKTIGNVIATSISHGNQNNFLNTFNYESVSRSQNPDQRVRQMLPVQHDIPREETLTYIEIYNQILGYLQLVTHHPKEVVDSIINEISKLKFRFDHIFDNSQKQFNRFDGEFLNSKISVYDTLLDLLDGQRNTILQQEDSPQKDINVRVNAEIIAEINDLAHSTLRILNTITKGRTTKRAIQ